MGFSTQGAASGAAAGSAFGPWGTAIGAVAGGFMGGNTPTPTQLPPAQAIGPVNSPYGSISQDPNTGAVYQSGPASAYSPTELYNQAMMSQLMGAPVSGPGSAEGMSYADARNNILAQMQAADQSVHGPITLAQANSVKDRLQAELAQLDAAHGQAAGVAQNNPMLQFLSQGKYNNVANTINMNADNAALAQQQALASRGLGASSISDLTNRQMALQRGIDLGNAMQNVGQQDFNSRAAMLQMLQGQNQGIQGQRLADQQMGLAYGGLGTGLAQGFANNQMQINATNAGLQNAGNWASYNANQRGMSDLGAGLGSMNWGGSSGSSGSPSYSGGNLATNPAYNFGSSNAMNPYGAYNPNASFSTNMSAAGGH